MKPTKQNADAQAFVASLKNSLRKGGYPPAEAFPIGCTEDKDGVRLRYKTAPAPAASITDTPADALALRKTITHASEQLLALAKAGDCRAVKALADTAAWSSIKLEELGRTKPALVRSVASKFPWWPVALSPHKTNQQEMLTLIDKLGVATATPEIMRGRWRNAESEFQPYRHTVGKYAVWIGQILRRVHANAPFCEAIYRDPTAWPEWMTEARNLPPLTKATAPRWFKVGWKMLQGLAPSGGVTAIEELQPVGNSNAAHWEREGFSKTIQKSQRAGAIRKALRLAFLGRFGNPVKGGFQASKAP